VSDFLAELRDEILQAHAAHAGRPAGRRAVRLAWGRVGPRGLVAATAFAACALAIAVAVRWLPPPEPTGPHPVGVVRIGGQPFDAVYAHGSLWVTDYRGARVLRVDPRARRIVARISVDGQPSAIAAAPAGGLWLRTEQPGADGTQLLRIDADGNRIASRVPIGPDVPIAVGGGAAWAAVWATDDNVPREGLYRVDAADGTSRRIDIPSVGRLAAGPQILWALRTNGTLVALDAATGRILGRLAQIVPAAGTGAGAHALAADATGAWVLRVPSAGAGELVRVEDGRVVNRLATAPGSQPTLAVTRGELWIAVRDAQDGGYRLDRLNPVTGGTTAQVDIGKHRPIALVVAGDRICAVAADGTVVVIRT
jgi:hypothetical protein